MENNISRMPHDNITYKYCIMSEPIGYILIGDNDYDYANDIEIMNLLRSYKKVMLSNSFNKPIDWLPNEITHLVIGTNFNHPLPNLPNNLKYLAFEPDGYYNTNTAFKQELCNLPYGLEELRLAIIGTNTYIGDNLPPTLKKLSIFNFEINNKTMIHINSFPDSIEYLHIEYFEIDSVKKLPNNLKIFKTNDNDGCLDKRFLEFKNLFPNVEFVVI